MLAIIINLRGGSYSWKSGRLGWGQTLANQAFDVGRKCTWISLPHLAHVKTRHRVLHLQTNHLVPFPLIHHHQPAGRPRSWLLHPGMWQGQFPGVIHQEQNVLVWHRDQGGERDSGVLSQEASLEPPSPQRWLPIWAHSLSHPGGSQCPHLRGHSLHPLCCYFPGWCCFSSCEQLQVRDTCVFLCLAVPSGCTRITPRNCKSSQQMGFVEHLGSATLCG